jgi:hypothetical protein
MPDPTITASDLMSLPVDQRKQLATALLQSLPAADQKEVAKVPASLDKPTQTVNDRIWLIMIVGFVIVLVGSFLAVASAVLFKPGTADSLLTVFTTVAGILAALLAPSPIKTGSSQA